MRRRQSRCRHVGCEVTRSRKPWGAGRTLAKGRALAFALVVGAGLLMVACDVPARRGRPQGRGLLVITVDGLRADHMSALGYDRPTTPTLDALANEGVLFANTFSTAPWLLPAEVSVLTGCEPVVALRDMGLEVPIERRWNVPDMAPRLAVELLVEGFRTAAFVDHEWMAPVYGFDAGFQDYSLSRPGQGQGVTWVGRRFLEWLQAVGQDESWFAFLHLDDLERVWGRTDHQWDSFFEPRPELDEVPPVGNEDVLFFAIPRAKWRGGSVSLGEYEARYDGAIRRLDAELLRLFDSLRVAGWWEHTTVCVVGTHGVQFGEAGMVLDHGRLSPADLHVPWILRPREQEGLRPGRVVRSMASLVDLAPTLLDLEGIPIPKGMHGVSQVEVAGDEGAEPPRSLAYASCGLQKGYAVFSEDLGLEVYEPAVATHPALVSSWFGDDRDHLGQIQEIAYERSRDPFPAPGEVDVEILAKVDPMRRALQRRMYFLAKTRAVLHVNPWPRDPIPPVVVQELQRLGYVGDDVRPSVVGKTP